MVRTIKYVAFLCFILTLVACGGISGSSIPKPSVAIGWPDLSRSVQAPIFARSAYISLSKTAFDSPLTLWTVDRPAGSNAQVLTYQAPNSVTPGPMVLTVQFMTETGGTGSQGAVARVSVILDSSGILHSSSGGPLGDVTYGITFPTLAIDTQSIGVGETSQLSVSGVVAGEHIALPPHSVTMSVLSGNDLLNLDGETATGIHEGTSVIRLTAENVQTDVPLRVVPRTANFARVEFPANHVAYDAVHNRIWGTFGPDSIHPNSIADINPSNGSTGNPIFVGSNPDQITISSDGTMAFVGLNGSSSVCQVNLSTRTVINTIPLTFQGNTVNITYLLASPYNPTEFAACVTGKAVSWFGGPIVVRNGVQIGGDPAIYSADQLAYGTANTILGYVGQFSPLTLRKFEISTNTIDQTLEKTLNAVSGGGLTVAGSKAVCGSGTVVDADSFAQLGEIGFGNENIVKMCSDTNHDMVWTISKSSDWQQSFTTISFRAFSLSTYSVADAVALPNNELSGREFRQVLRYGSTGLAATDGQWLYLIPEAPGLAN